ncbi:hypothetical protein [Bernardetia sp.]|uniref:hypothetical protein n=1 Tax=Bernardetia sp. TaxID=1937974 RepID=UPI0025C6F9BE|nr:hypothetical protein [Bernardetia sp.]
MNIQSKLFRFFVLLITVSMLGFTACKESEETEPEEDTQAAFDTSKDVETAEAQFFDAYNTALDGLDGELDGSRSGRVESCAIITNDEVARVLTIDFGTGCVGEDGRNRSGKIMIGYRDGDRSTRDELTITFENYTVNDYGVNGTLGTNGFSKNSSDQWQYNLTLENGILTFPDRSMQLSFEKLYTWTEGTGNLDAGDDVFTITGNSSGTTADGIAFTSTITTPLTKKSICWTSQIIYPVSGILTIEFTGNSTGRAVPSVTLDYGNGDCDKEATITAGNRTEVITLP